MSSQGLTQLDCDLAYDDEQSDKSGDFSWCVHERVAEWWDGCDLPKLVLQLPPGVEWSPGLKALLESAFNRGHAHGEASGRNKQRAEIRAALGV